MQRNGRKNDKTVQNVKCLIKLFIITVKGSLFKIHFFRLNVCYPFITAKLLMLSSSANDFTNDEVITVQMRAC